MARWAASDEHERAEPMIARTWLIQNIVGRKERAKSRHDSELRVLKPG